MSYIPQEHEFRGLILLTLLSKNHSKRQKWDSDPPPRQPDLSRPRPSALSPPLRSSPRPLPGHFPSSAPSRFAFPSRASAIGRPDPGKGVGVLGGGRERARTRANGSRRQQARPRGAQPRPRRGPRGGVAGRGSSSVVGDTKYRRRPDSSRLQSAGPGSGARPGRGRRGGGAGLYQELRIRRGEAGPESARAARLGGAAPPGGHASTPAAGAGGGSASVVRACVLLRWPECCLAAPGECARSRSRSRSRSRGWEVRAPGFRGPGSETRRLSAALAARALTLGRALGPRRCLSRRTVARRARLRPRSFPGRPFASS